MIHVLLYAPEYRPNLSSMIRTAEFYGCKNVYIYDQNNLMVPPVQSKKARAEMAHMARVWTAGAIEYIDIVKVDDVGHFLASYKGRVVATKVDPSASVLSSFQFKDGDLIIMGPEKDGLPEGISSFIDESVYLPQKGNTSCLNVAVTFGIVMQQAIQQTQ